MLNYLDFEKPIAELETKVAELRETASSTDIDIDAEVGRLETKANKLLRDTYAKLTPWQKAAVARHPDRPHFKDYVAGLADDFLPLAGDRAFADDPAIVGGLARIDGRRVMLMGHEKGDDTASRLRHNFGMAKPEGYRKAIRLMKLANRFGIPVVSLVDTPGAFPGVQAEERGQAEAIARSTEECLMLEVPIIAAIVGEGGSGGAVAIATANRVLMFEHAVYSVISPEGCASILWRTGDKAADAAEAIARSTEACLALGVPMIAAIVGEGGSGGAIAVAAANKVLMFEHAVYSVISPEGCASILWRTGDKAAEAAEAMKVTAADLEKLGVVDRIVAEPMGGAHRDPATAIAALGAAIGEELDKLSGKKPDALRAARRDKFLAIG